MCFWDEVFFVQLMQLQNIFNLNLSAFINNFLTSSIFNSMTCHVINNKLLSLPGIFFPIFFSLVILKY